MICVKVKKKKRALVKILIEQNFIATWNKVIFKNLIRLDIPYHTIPYDIPLFALWRANNAHASTLSQYTLCTSSWQVEKSCFSRVFFFQR